MDEDEKKENWRQLQLHNPGGTFAWVNMRANSAGAPAMLWQGEDGAVERYELHRGDSYRLPNAVTRRGIQIHDCWQTGGVILLNNSGTYANDDLIYDNPHLTSTRYSLQCRIDPAITKDASQFVWLLENGNLQTLDGAVWNVWNDDEWTVLRPGKYQLLSVQSYVGGDVSIRSLDGKERTATFANPALPVVLPEPQGNQQVKKIVRNGVPSAMACHYFCKRRHWKTWTYAGRRKICAIQKTRICSRCRATKTYEDDDFRYQSWRCDACAYEMLTSLLERLNYLTRKMLSTADDGRMLRDIKRVRALWQQFSDSAPTHTVESECLVLECC